MDKSALDAALLAAHAADDRARLVTLYAEAADVSPEAESFYLTQAYIFALEAGDMRAEALRARLVALGAEVARDEPPPPPAPGGRPRS